MSKALHRRIAPRRNTRIEASIVFAGGRSRRSCIVRNVSDTGAKIEIVPVGDIPNNFDLLVPGHQPQPCRVVGRALREIEVAYQGEPRGR